jgi:hypothetical protein
MPTIFQDVLTDANSVQEKLLGPDYPYYKNIKSPSEIGMSSDGNLAAFGRDINGMISYASLLVSGNSTASATGKPLGNKFFLKTGATCIDKETSKEVDRYIYVNNVPQGNVPFISSGMGVNFTEFRGLIPGTISNLNVLNPFGIMGAFLSGSKPPCQNVKMETIDAHNSHSSETHYLTTVDIQNMDPCNFPSRKNPVTGDPCRETFKNPPDPELSLPDDFLAKLFIWSLCALIIYVIYKLLNKNN